MHKVSSFRSPYLFYLLTVGVEVVYFHLITLTHHSRQDSPGRGIGPSQRSIPDNTNTVHETNNHAPGGIGTHDPSKSSSADLRLRPRGQIHKVDKHKLKCRDIKGSRFRCKFTVVYIPCTYKHLSRSYEIRRDLVQMNRVKCVVSGSVVYSKIYEIST
jgi:hypothetical protein